MPTSDLKSYTSVFRAHGNKDDHKVTKRNRQPMSCEDCRVRKLKCDRQQPCGACLRRGDGRSCEFTSGPDAAVPREKKRSRTEAQARLQKLEEMVNGLVRSTKSDPVTVSSQDVGSHDSVHDVLARRSPVHSGRSFCSRLGEQGSEPSYAGATHWGAILESIRDIRGFLESDTEAMTNLSPHPPPTSSAQDLICNSIEPLTSTDVLAALPPRPITDRLLSIYFNARFIAAPLLHAHKFQREYEAFWENPSSTSFLWISMLFSALGISYVVASSSGQIALLPMYECDPALLMRKASQCLATGQYLKAQPHAIEALLLYSFAKFVQSKDPDPTLFAVFGLVTRLAQRMGYHRDPRHFLSKVSPFEGEMRRRVWYFVETFDLLFSFQLGMPAIVHEHECDTELPGNLFDDDFDEDCTSLPASRPASDPTPMLYYRFKGRLMRIFRHVIRHALSTERPVYEKTCQIDEALRALHRETPSSLRYRPIKSSSFTDQPYVIMQRTMIKLLHHASLCVLHRTYLSLEKDNPKFDFSRQTCVTSALEVLDLQDELHQESKPAGRLCNDGWMFSSFTLHDFLLAAMILCVDLSEFTPSSAEEQSRKLKALKSSHDMWSERSYESREAAHAARVLATILTKVSGRRALRTSAGLPTPPTSNSYMARTENGTSHAHVQDGTHEGFPDPVQDTYEPMQDLSLDFTDLEPLDNVLGSQGDLDWNLIDQLLYDRNVDFGVGLDLTQLETPAEPIHTDANANAEEQDEQGATSYPGSARY